MTSAGRGDRADSGHPPEFERLAAELSERFARGVDEAWTDFDDIAGRVFAYQLATSFAYRAYAVGRGVDPGGVPSWRDMPAVPAAAFKHLELVSGPRGAVERVFRTSGTSRGLAGRGVHLVPSLDLYRAAALPNLAAHLLPEGGRIRMLSLIPGPDEQPDSSLSAMIGFALAELGAPESGVYAGVAGGVDVSAFDGALARACAEDVPVLLTGTAFAFVHWLDGSRTSVRLPEGSRLMETGGFKGRSREVTREELYRTLAARLGIPAERMVNEYGMTELLSQFWEPVLREGTADRRRHVAPPWVRTRVLDPVTLAELPSGEPGLLCHVDLANLGSVAAVLTEDVGIAVDDGFRLVGRAPGAELRGCSLALDELLAASDA